MSSEFNGQPGTGAGHAGPSAHSAPRIRLALGRVLRAPFRSVFDHQARLLQEHGHAIDELRHRQLRLERDVRLNEGDLVGALLGQLSEIRYAVHGLERRIERLEGHLGAAAGAPPVAHRPSGSAPTVGRVRPVPRLSSAGVNLIGDLTATTGLAEAARRLAAGLARRGIPLALTEVRSGAPQIAELLPPELRRAATGRPAPVDLVTLNVNELDGLAGVEIGRTRTGRHAIATWAWEFETLPSDLVEQIERVDEIWVPSEFSRRAFQRYTDVPVRVSPNIVPLRTAAGPRDQLRSRWGATGDEVIYLFSFDFNSSILRKNPFGVIDAYRQAFGTVSPETRLVIKAINLSIGPEFAEDLRRALKEVGGVLIDEHLTAEDLGGLFHACDVYVSLHRSEGFGLGMAEAMALGKAVVGTGYSGNVDFMDGTNSVPVGYRLRPVVPEDHRYSGAVGTLYRPGFFCAEPDVDQAARWMRALAEDPGLRRRLGAAASATMAGRFSEAAVIDTALTRLNALAGTCEVS